MSDDFLTRFRKAPPPAFEATLYQRISTSMNTQPRFKALRTLAVSMAGLAAVLTAVYFVSPPARAFAEDIWRQVGGFIFVQGNPDCPEAKPDNPPCDEPTKDPSKAGIPTDKQKNPDKVTVGGTRVPDATAPDAAGASALISFTVLTPAYVPDGFAPDGPWGIVQNGSSTEARFGYSNASGERLVISEARQNPGTSPSTYTRPEVEDVTVRGVKGVWLPGDKATLIWEENGIVYAVTSVLNTLPKSELLKVAESLGK